MPDKNKENHTPVIVIEHLCKAFGKNVVLDDFNLTVQKDENVVVLGKSGAGKSVLIKCIIGLLKPDSGSILVFGDNVARLSHDDLDRYAQKLAFFSKAMHSMIR